MNRQEICAKVSELRIIYGKTWLDLSLTTKKNEAVIRSVVSADKNFFVDTLLSILTALNAKLVVTNGALSFDIVSEPELTEWLIYTRERSKMTIGKFAETVGLSRNSVSTYLLGKAKMRIDTFIKWAELTGYSISVVAPPHRDIKI